MLLHSFIDPILEPTAKVGIAGVCLMILLDFVLGLGGALMTGTFSSPKMRDGLVHKYTELCAVVMGAILDGVLSGGFDLPIQPILLGTCGYIIIMETGSVLELIKKYNPEAEGLVGWLTNLVRAKGVEDAES